MTFLSPHHVNLTPRALSQVLAEIISCPDEEHIPALCWVVKMTNRSKDGEVISKKHNFFFWGCHHRSVVPEDLRWSIDGAEFAIQDGRWQVGRALTLGFTKGVLTIEPT